VKGSVFVVDSGNTRVEQFMPAEEGGERLQENAETVAEIGNAQPVKPEA
jgi:tripartite motif-containing protein 71